ncbi:MAG TPA: carboxypeptidase-like regulatory domain-containing protein, partial [Chitinophagales bacterium]|nr:carboxypeptidase-like regulatory domain-containing protein [Chitinophagales bacterium]
MRHLLTILLCFCSTFVVFAQTASLSGRVYDALNNDPIPFANVVLQNTNFVTTTDDNGNYTFSNLPASLYNIIVSFVGYKNATIFEVQLSNARPTIIDIPLENSAEELKTVEIK